MKIQIIARQPTTAEFNALIRSVGWAKYFNLKSTPVALKHSLHCVVAIERGKVVGMGRIVGDGAIFFYIQDLIVHPKFQGRGAGTKILDALMAWLDEHAPLKSYVSLFTSKHDAPFYERYGFKGPEFLYGMCVKKRKKGLRRTTLT